MGQIKTPYSIAIIMTSHNRKDVTMHCLRDLFKCRIPEGVSIKTYLMDDGCTDGTPEAVASEFPQVKLLKGNGNLYWNRGTYECWKVAMADKHDAYMWLNDDVFLFENVFEEILEVYVTIPDKSIVTGHLHASKDSNEPCYGGLINWEPFAPTGKPVKVLASCGNVFFVPQCVVDVMGNVCHLYKHKFGDYDYSIRAVKKGVDVYTTRCYVGICDHRRNIEVWESPDYPLGVRLKRFFSTTGVAPIEYAIYCFRTRPFKTALLSSILIPLGHFKHCLFPRTKK